MVGALNKNGQNKGNGRKRTPGFGKENKLTVANNRTGQSIQQWQRMISTIPLETRASQRKRHGESTHGQYLEV